MFSSFSPFFSEDYSFRVPRDFSKLSFYLCEPGLHKDSQFGKLSILHDDLKANGTREEQWYPIQHIDADSEVQVCTNSLGVPYTTDYLHHQGKIHLSLTIEEIEVNEGDSKQTHQMLTIK